MCVNRNPSEVGSLICFGSVFHFPISIYIFLLFSVFLQCVRAAVTSLLLYNNDRGQGRRQQTDRKRHHRNAFPFPAFSPVFPHFSALFRCGYLGGSEPISTDPIRSNPIRFETRSLLSSSKPSSFLYSFSTFHLACQCPLLPFVCPVWFAYFTHAGFLDFTDCA